MLRVLFLCLIFSISAHSFQRKKEQFHDTYSHIIMPAPYQIPGIGSGWIYYAGIHNFALDYMDFSLYQFTGAANGTGVNLRDIHLWKKHLFVGFGREQIKEASLQTYNQRGFAGNEDDFSLLKGSHIERSSAHAVLTFLERRINFYYEWKSELYNLDKIESGKGKELVTLSLKDKVGEEKTKAGILLDITNDMQDPDIGLRVDINRESFNSEKSLSDSEFHVINQSYTLYVPVGAINVLALNFFKSDAHVQNRGSLDPATVRNRLGLNNCANHSSPSDQQTCQKIQDDLVDRLLGENRHGSAQTLGGQNRLRGYPAGRFKGAHSLFYGGEFRWNLDRSVIPFDLFLMRDTRSGFQLAFFYEKGASGDLESELGENMQEAFGTGFRLVTASGFVYRVDWGKSPEGSQTTIIGSYPW